VTLVERHSRFTTLIKVPSKDTAVVVAALTRHAPGFENVCNCTRPKSPINEIRVTMRCQEYDL
jgi:hypothetical protein